MKNIVIGSLLALILSGYKYPDITICNRVYVQKQVSCFLKDENCDAKMIQLVNKRTKREIFGYFIKAVRNDTTFIYSKLRQTNNEIKVVTYYQYHISRSRDSTVNTYRCTAKGLVFEKSESYSKGKVMNTQIFNRVMDGGR